MLPRAKKSQAAIEYLSTYGWALLIALAVIWVIIYFGLLSPDKFVREKCDFGDKIKCVDFFVSNQGEIIIKLFNSYDDNIIIENVKGVDIPLRKCAVLNLTGGSTKDLFCNTTYSLTRGEKKNMHFILEYRRDAAGAPTHRLIGEIIASVQRSEGLPRCSELGEGGTIICYPPYSYCPEGHSIPDFEPGVCCVADECDPPPQCDDGEDNDGDNAADYGGAGGLGPDLGCDSWDDDYEGDRTTNDCSLGYCDVLNPEGYMCCLGICSPNEYKAPIGWCCLGGVCCMGSKNCFEDPDIE